MHSKLFYINCLLLLSSFTLSAQQKYAGVIWSENILTWKHYTEVEKITGSTAIARTYLKLDLNFPDSAYPAADGKKEVLVAVHALVIPALSYVRTGYDVPSTLAHEQIHFDILELHARKLRKIIAESDFKANDYKRKITAAHRKLVKQLGKMQDQYDEQHRSADKGHNWWSATIETQLAELAAYATPEMKISVCTCK